MRIAFLIRSLGSGGAERAAVSLAGCMARKGHDVLLCVLTNEKAFYTVDPAVTTVCIDTQSDGRGTIAPTDFLRRVAALRRMLRLQKPQILVGMSHTMSVYAVVAARALPVRTVGTERANPFVYSATPLHTALRKWAAVRCDGFVCQTQKALSFFPPSVRKKAKIIPNGLFNPLIENISVPNEREKTITAMGRLDRNKGFDLLLHAFRTIHDRAPEYTLTIFGEGELRNELTALAAKLDVASAVSLPGNDPNALYTIAKSSAFVLSSRSEGMPNALMEAMAVGVPCVATRCDMGPEELIEDGVNGLLVPVEDPDAISQAVLKIIRYRNISESLSACSLRIRNTHSLDFVAGCWLDYFGTLL